MLLPRGFEIAGVFFSILRLILSAQAETKDVVCKVQGNTKQGSQSQFSLHL